MFTGTLSASLVALTHSLRDARDSEGAKYLAEVLQSNIAFKYPFVFPVWTYPSSDRANLDPRRWLCNGEKGCGEENAIENDFCSQCQLPKPESALVRCASIYLLVESAHSLTARNVNVLIQTMARKKSLLPDIRRFAEFAYLIPSIRDDELYGVGLAETLTKTFMRANKMPDATRYFILYLRNVGVKTPSFTLVSEYFDAY